MYDLKILVPVSLRSSADNAIEQAIAIAKGRDAMITCLHVIEKPGFLSGLKDLHPEDHVTKGKIEIEFSSRVNDIFEAHKDVPFELVVTGGKVYKRVLEKARELHVDLIVMGRSDTVQSHTNYLGSNTLRVISASNVPVMSVRMAGSTTPKHMLMPLWSGKEMSKQISMAIELSELLGLKVTVAHIIGPGYRRGESTYRMRLEMVRKIFLNAGILCDSMIIADEDSPREDIMNKTQDLGADLIYLVNQGESEMSHSYFGSDIHYILRYSESTVLTVNPAVYDSQSFEGDSVHKKRRPRGKTSNIDNHVLN